MFKKIAVLAMAVGVMAAFALPTSASALWKHHGNAIENDADLGLTGQARFQGGIGGVECQVTSAVKFIAGQTSGEVSSFTPEPTSDTANCRGLGGLAFCQIHDVAPTGFPWAIETVQSPASISITHGEIHSQATGAFCPVEMITITHGTVVATPNQPNTVTSVQLSGQAHVHLQTNGAVQGDTQGALDTELTTVSGSLTVESPNAHTYDI